MKIDLDRLKRGYEKELDKLEERRVVLLENIKKIDEVRHLAEELPEDGEGDSGEDEKPEGEKKEAVKAESKTDTTEPDGGKNKGEKKESADEKSDTKAAKAATGSTNGDNDAEKADREAASDAAAALVEVDLKSAGLDDQIQVEWVPPGPEWQRRQQ